MRFASLFLRDVRSGGRGLGATAFGQRSLDEAYFAAQDVGGFAAELRLARHQVKKGLALDVQDFGFGGTDSDEAVGVPGECGGQTQ